MIRIFWVLGIVSMPLLLSCQGPMHLSSRDYDTGRAAFDALEQKLVSIDNGDREATDRWERLYRSQLLRKVSTHSPAFDAIVNYDFAISLKSLTGSELRIAMMGRDSGWSPSEAAAARQKSVKLTRRFSEADAAVKLCRDEAAQYFLPGVRATDACSKALAPLRAAFHAEHPEL
ncbi:MAG TPA: hypothetical protein VMH81_29105 [Bryobacteraceae bacterium]|nr:hypothetical protein [Bryobacteraceae bacterium]